MADPMAHGEAEGWIRAARADWRSLTGGPETPDELRPTLIGVSGGADSAALAIALATLRSARIVLVHVLHDQRPAEVVHDDRVAVAELAEQLAVPLVVRHARSGLGNAEHEARRARYAEFERVATEHGCAFVATGHHARDQAETMLLAMIRGASPRAMLGIRRVRSISGGSVQVIRPALTLSPSGACAVCRRFAFVPRQDATNRDPARARARLRFAVVPLLDRCSTNLGVSLARTVGRLERGLGSSVVEEPAHIGLERVDALPVHN